MFELMYYIAGVFTGIILTLIACIFGKENPNFVDKVGNKIIKHKAYIAGSDQDVEQMPNDEAVIIR